MSGVVELFVGKGPDIALSKADVDDDVLPECWGGDGVMGFGCLIVGLILGLVVGLILILILGLGLGLIASLMRFGGFAWCLL